jgi:protein TonB
MFDDLVESGVAKQRTKKPWTVAVSLIVECLLVAILVLIPLIYTQVLPATVWATTMTAPPPPPPPPPPPQAAEQVTVTRRSVVRLLRNGELTAPAAIPRQVAMIREDALPPDVGSMGVEGGVPGGVEEGSQGGVLGGILSGMPSTEPAPPKETQRIRLGGQVQAAKLISQPIPEYPALARQAQVQGTVLLHAIISKDGHVEQLSG